MSAMSSNRRDRTENSNQCTGSAGRMGAIAMGLSVLIAYCSYIGRQTTQNCFLRVEYLTRAHELLLLCVTACALSLSPVWQVA